ncbi:hypothetical protein JCM14244_05680 [Venenivibrio stagnispumantis]|uniref:Uncharacterized protein n=1 Tax=Venenivibrio stagnispumantis TaxID=407998 RepID=A0AA45WI60_9AQUI|nr:hypothetical protein [Venenivibrio stagnispumantis]MCW4572742.1 hypothetical protein [Venenivibrio stagnispumantis]SMP00233.1 hypothetical protein SAMN06264868_10129 [Venenivibrio stagnispumantis]
MKDELDKLFDDVLVILAQKNFDFNNFKENIERLSSVVFNIDINSLPEEDKKLLLDKINNLLNLLAEKQKEMIKSIEGKKLEQKYINNMQIS